MAKAEILGEMVCPECGAAGAQIKRSKSGLLYRWCAQGCNAQFFARCEDQEYAMRKHLFPAPVTVTKPEEKPEEAPAPVTVTVSKQEPKPQPKPQPKPVTVSKPEQKQQQKKTAGFSLADLMGVNHEQ